MTYFVYMIEVIAKDGSSSLYTGYTNNLVRRFNEHAADLGAQYTKGRTKLTIVHFESFATQVEAMNRERVIKSLSRKKKLQLVDSDIA